MPDLLLELFSEEIPARMQKRAAEDLRKLVTDGLVERGLTYADAGAFVTPRRLTLTINGLSEASQDKRIERKGPRVDAPQKALEGFLRSTGLAKDDLEIRDEKKSQVWFAVFTEAGRPATEIVAETVEDVVRNFPWPKSMRWGAGSLRWVRPLHSILCILRNDVESVVVPFDIDGIKSGNQTRGHRFMAPEPILVVDFDQYRSELEKAYVLLDTNDRAAKIDNDARQLAFAQGLDLLEDTGLLNEVAGLVEWPVVSLGRIEEKFLALPPEVLQTSMKEHQKFLSLRDPAQKQIVGYIVVANRETADDGAAILAGNARVLAARLSDAVFFWENDLRRPLEDMVAQLDTVTFHGKLGTQGARIERIAQLAEALASKTGADPALAARAAKLAKADLSSEMVYEFPELQGIMGSYYAAKAGEDPAVAAAAAEHYSPLGPADNVPRAPVSVTVALADKIDMLTAFWAIGEKPTGSKDPFALRRAALGVIRLILDNDLRLSLTDVLRLGYTGADITDLAQFFMDRLKVYLRDQGLRHDAISAAVALEDQDDLVQLVARIRAVDEFLKTDDGANLLAGYRRAVNILTQEEARDGVEYSLDPMAGLAETDSEKTLFEALDAAEPEINYAIEAESYDQAMTALSRLRTPIDGFFEETIVNSDNASVRRNRLCLLNRIRQITNKIALFSVIEG